MTDDFRDSLNRRWQMQRVHDAIEAYRDAINTAWYDYYRELRPPCQCGSPTHCGNCDCCRKEITR